MTTAVHMEGETLPDVQIEDDNGVWVVLRQDDQEITMTPEAARSLAFIIIGMTRGGE